jgi:hypothetical protein
VNERESVDGEALVYGRFLRVKFVAAENRYAHSAYSVATEVGYENSIFFLFAFLEKFF